MYLNAAIAANYYFDSIDGLYEDLDELVLDSKTRILRDEYNDYFRTLYQRNNDEQKIIERL